MPAVRLAVRGMRTDLSGDALPLGAKGRFALTAPGLRLRASYRRESAGALAVSLLSADPFVILYRGSGPAIGRLPPARHITLRLNRTAVLRLRRPGHEEVRLRLTLETIKPLETEGLPKEAVGSP